MKTRPLLMITVLAAAVGAAAQTLDQEYNPATFTTSVGIDNTWSRAQTFTVGATGLLDSFAVNLTGINTADLLLWDLRSTTGGAPNASDTVVLAAGSVTSSSLSQATPSFYVIDLASFGVSVTSGDVLAIALRATSASTIAAWRGRLDNSYAGGAAYFGTPGAGSSTWSLQPATDLAFRTYLAVPEPSTYATIAGIFALGAAAWGRKWLRDRRN